MSRHGKIARLPLAIREELNRHLRESQKTGATLVAWLNSLPEVRASLQTHFHGKPIREQNLSEWRKGGYQDWLQQQERLELTTRLCNQVASMAESGNTSPTAILDRLTVVHYATTAHERRHATQGKERWRLMRQICADYTKLRRAELAAQRFEFQRTRSTVKSPTPNFQYANRRIRLNPSESDQSAFKTAVPRSQSVLKSNFRIQGAQTCLNPEGAQPVAGGRERNERTPRNPSKKVIRPRQGRSAVQPDRRSPSRVAPVSHAHPAL